MVMGFILIWAVTAFALWLTTLIVPGVRARSAGGLWLAALVLGLVNAFIRPLLLVLTLPLTVLSFGLFALVINALMIWLAAQLVSDFEVDGFGSAFLAALVMAFLGLLAFVVLELMMLGTVHWMTMTV